jgi:predicted amidohydrolase
MHSPKGQSGPFDGPRSYCPDRRSSSRCHGAARLSVSVARRQGVWILVGILAETSGDPLRPFNPSTPIGPDGSIEVLLRARSIENGAYVIAPSQIGRRPAHLRSGARW